VQAENHLKTNVGLIPRRLLEKLEVPGRKGPRRKKPRPKKKGRALRETERAA